MLILGEKNTGRGDEGEGGTHTHTFTYLFKHLPSGPFIKGTVQRIKHIHIGVRPSLNPSTEPLPSSQTGPLFPLNSHIKQ